MPRHALPLLKARSSRHGMRHVQTPTFVMRPSMRCPALRRDKAATVPKRNARQRLLMGAAL